jgi:hypothetical protein
MQGSCGRGNEPSGSTRRSEALENLHNWRPLKKGSSPRSQLCLSRYLSKPHNKCKGKILPVLN